MYSSSPLEADIMVWSFILNNKGHGCYVDSDDVSDSVIRCFYVPGQVGVDDSKQKDFGDGWDEYSRECFLITDMYFRSSFEMIMWKLVRECFWSARIKTGNVRSSLMKVDGCKKRPKMDL